jgi:hypothetical protein
LRLSPHRVWIGTCLRLPIRTVVGTRINPPDIPPWLNSDRSARWLCQTHVPQFNQIKPHKRHSNTSAIALSCHQNTRGQNSIVGVLTPCESSHTWQRHPIYIWLVRSQSFET